MNHRQVIGNFGRIRQRSDTPDWGSILDSVSAAVSNPVAETLNEVPGRSLVSVDRVRP
jgi:hypothetical protein